MSDDLMHAAGELGDSVGMGRPDADLAKVFEDEALRVVAAGEKKGVHLRIIGALAFHHHCPEFAWIQTRLNRVYTDIDFAAYGKQNAQIRELFVALGYAEDLEINAFHAEGGRLIFNNPTSHIHVDVFMDKLDFCHPIPWRAASRSTRPRSRWPSCSSRRCRSSRSTRRTSSTRSCCCASTPSPATTPTTSTPRSSPSCAPASGASAHDHHEPRKGARLPAPPRPRGGRQAVVAGRVAELLAAMDDYPKGTKWRLRARVGDKVRWYNVID